MTTTGMLLGKFMPPHKGHIYLARFAENYVDKLSIVVGSLESEPIPGDLRYQWMKKIFPDCNVIHLAEELPQYPEEHPDFWQIWHDVLMRILPEPPDYVFAGEDYGAKLAETLGAVFVPSSTGRGIIPVSGTAIRNNPSEHWDYIPETVRPYFVKRIAVIGAESTGKTTLAAKLAQHFQTVNVPEYAETLILHKGRDLAKKDFEMIVRAQKASEDALMYQARRVLFCDTETMTTAIWQEMLLGYCPSWLDEAARKSNYDLYLLLDNDAGWQDDKHRYGAKTQDVFMKSCLERLEQDKKNYLRLSGDRDQKLHSAIKAVGDIIGVRP